MQDEKKDLVPRSFKLNSGYDMPSLGFGTHDLKSGDSIVTAVCDAGYRHIDTAMLYGNEEMIGEALQRCYEKGIKREDLFICTKLWCSEYNDVEAAIKASMARLQTDYIDLYIIHWPHMYYAKPMISLQTLWGNMEGLVEKKLARSIGVSNFNTQLCWDLLTYCKIKPAVNQIELNPQCTQSELCKFLKAKDIQAVGFTPVARPGAVEKGDALVPKDWPDMRENKYLQELAAKYNKSVPQIMLNFGLTRGNAVIPKAASFKWQVENQNIFDFRLTDEEIAGCEKLNGPIRLCNKFDFNEHFDVWA